MFSGTRAHASLDYRFSTASMVGLSISGYTRVSLIIQIGLGAFLSPLLFQILEIHHLRWQHFFYISSVMAIFNVALAVWAFHPTQKEFERDRDRALSSVFSGLPSTTSDAQRIGDATQSEAAKTPSNGRYSYPMANRSDADVQFQ